MEDARKRRLVTAVDDENSFEPPRKKGALASASEQVNGDSSAIDEGLEAFRKEAIWRQMNEYKRECQRAVERETQLSDKLHDAEARALAVEACWNTLLADARALSFNGVDGIADAVPSLTWATSTPLAPLQAALESRFQQTKALFTRLTSSAPSTSRQGSESEDLRARCHQLSAEVASARAAVAALDAQLVNAKNDFEQQHARLLAAEKQFDRSQSKTVRDLDAKAEPVPQGPPKVEVAAEPSSAVKTEKPIEGTSTGLGSHAVPVDEGELADLRDQASRRQAEIEHLYSTRTTLTRAVDDLKTKLADLPESAIVDSSAYQKLTGRITALQGDLERARYDIDAAQKEAELLRDQQTEWRDTLQKDISQQLDQANQRIAKHEADLSRVRAQREEYKAEVLESKARDTEKMRQVDQIRTLANSRQDCITAMGSEVRRLKMLIRANEGNMDMVESLAAGEDEVQLKALMDKLKDAENIALALRDQLKAYSSTAGGTETAAIIRSETTAREELVRTKQRLEKLEKLFATEGGADPEVSRLAMAASEREDRIRSLEANVKARDQSMDMLVAEVERLSAAWATLDEQNRDKVLSLVTLEERMTRAVSEKAKADNRYFAAMRAKEQLQNEMAVHQKTTTSQGKVIEAMTDARNSLSARLGSAEKEIISHQQNNRAYQDRIAELVAAANDKDLELQGAERRLAEAQTLLAHRTHQSESDAASVRRLEEHIVTLERDLASAKAAAKTATRKGGVDEDLRQHNEDLTKMLKCSACALRFKSHVILRCYHIFCKECIELRVSTRQRKCPSCQSAFGAQDYTQVYF